MKNTFYKIKNYFKNLSQRERFILLAFSLIAVLMWAVYLKNKNSSLNEKLEQLQRDEKISDIAIAQKPIIETNLEEIKKEILPEKTYTASALQVFIETLAKKYGLSYEIASVSTTKAGNFEIHTVNVSFSRVMIENLIAFENDILDVNPYITITKSSFSSAGNGLVSVRYSLMSFTFKN